MLNISINNININIHINININMTALLSTYLQYALLIAKEGVRPRRTAPQACDPMGEPASRALDAL